MKTRSLADTIRSLAKHARSSETTIESMRLHREKHPAPQVTCRRIEPLADYFDRTKGDKQRSLRKLGHTNGGGSDAK